MGRGIEIRVDRPVGLLCASRRVATRPNGSRAAATEGVWNALETGKSRPEIPRRAARSIASLTAAAGPAITVCTGPFQLATWTPWTWRMIASASAGAARRAAIAPERPAPASFINRPRSIESSAKPRAVEGAGRMERHKLAEAMPGEQARLAAEAAQEAKHRQTGGPDGRLSDVSFHEAQARFFALDIAECRRREYERPDRAAPLSQQQPVEFLERLPDFGKNDRELPKHAGRLRALAGEQKGHRRA